MCYLTVSLIVKSWNDQLTKISVQCTAASAQRWRAYFTRLRENWDAFRIHILDNELLEMPTELHCAGLWAETRTSPHTTWHLPALLAQSFGKFVVCEPSFKYEMKSNMNQEVNVMWSFLRVLNVIVCGIWESAAVVILHQSFHAYLCWSVV